MHRVFSHVCFDQEINEERTLCLEKTKKKKRSPEGHDLCFSVPYVVSHSELPNTLPSAEPQAEFIQTTIYKRCLDFNNLFICSANLDNVIKSRSLKFSSNIKRSMSGRLEMRLEFKMTG